jgi:hypothetical protein
MMGSRLAGHLDEAILNQDDPEIIRSGAPSFLILVDALVRDDPNNVPLLRAAATLNGTYSSVFVNSPERAGKLADKAHHYAQRAICQDHPWFCEHEHAELSDFVTHLNATEMSDITNLYVYGTTWATWIQTHSQNWDAIADLPKIEAIMQRIVVLDEKYEWGRAHLYLGVIHSQLSPALGGNPENGRAHFERALAISAGKDLIAKVEFARNYARLTFNQPLHDQLLNEVLAADPNVPNLVLTNQLARQYARELLDSSKRYFED